MRRFTAVACLVGLVGASASGSALAQAQTFTDTEKIPVFVDEGGIEVFVECANDGAGETVVLGRTLLLITHTTVKPSGEAITKFHVSPQGVNGLGLTTGDIYRGVGVTQHVAVSKAGLPTTATYENNFGIIGPGPGNNLFDHMVLVVTLDQSGQITETLITRHETSTCK
jgi:hypothetical protein